MGGGTHWSELFCFLWNFNSAVSSHNTRWMESVLRVTAQCQLKLAISATLMSDLWSDENVSVTDYIRLLFCKDLSFEPKPQRPIHWRRWLVRSTLRTFHRCLLQFPLTRLLYCSDLYLWRHSPQGLITCEMDVGDKWRLDDLPSHAVQIKSSLLAIAWPDVTSLRPISWCFSGLFIYLFIYTKSLKVTLSSFFMWFYFYINAQV